MTQRNNLYRRSSGIYVLRIVVPARYRVQVGQAEIHISTHLRDLLPAKELACHLLNSWNLNLSEWEMGTSEKSDAGEDRKAVTSIVEFSSRCGLPVAQLLREILNKNIPIFYEAYERAGFLVENIADLDREPETGGFDISSAMQWGVPHTFSRYLKPIRPRSTILSIIESDFSEEAVFKIIKARGEATRYAVFDLPGIRLTAKTILMLKIQAERLLMTTRSTEKAFAQTLPSVSATNFPTNSIATVTRPSASVPTVNIAAPDGSGASIAPLPPLPCECCRAERAEEPVSRLLETFLSKKEHSWKISGQLSKMKTHCGTFVDLMNDPPLGSLDRKMIWDYIDKLKRMPSNRASASRRHGTTDANELLRLAEKFNEEKTSPTTVERYVDSLSSMFTWAVYNMILTRNPAQRAIEKQKKTTRDQDERFLFDKIHLDRIFSAQWFSTGTGERNKQGRFHQFRPHFYWLPLLGLYTGGRINELCQLYIEDIKCSESGVYYIDFNLDTPDKMDADLRDSAAGGSDKTLKTVNSRRIIALHPHLLKLGFLTYVKALSQVGHNRLFPELKRDSVKGYGKPAGSWFNERFLGKQLMVPRDGKRTFHSFRHNFITALSEQGVPTDIIAQLAGHSRGSTETTGRYRKDAEAERLLNYVKLVDFQLPEIKPFVIADGLDAINDALRRKNRPLQ